MKRAYLALLAIGVAVLLGFPIAGYFFLGALACLALTGGALLLGLDDAWVKRLAGLGGGLVISGIVLEALQGGVRAHLSWEDFSFHGGLPLLTLLAGLCGLTLLVLGVAHVVALRAKAPVRQPRLQTRPRTRLVEPVRAPERSLATPQQTPSSSRGDDLDLLGGGRDRR